MATLTPTLTLVSTDAVTDSLSLSVTDSLTVAEPITGISVEMVTTTGTNHVVAASATAVQYLYVKHTGFQQDGSTASTDNLDLEITDDSSAFARLAAGEFLFMPFNHAGADVGVQLQATANTIKAEYAVFTKG